MKTGERFEQAAPVASAERVGELDILRGAALFGVFLVNMTAFAGAGVMATEAQLAALPSADIDKLVRVAVRWLAFDKANTLFAFLFGLGFWLQMERINRRGGDFQRIYVRRLSVLLGFGLIHLWLIFTWDTLHTYAICGFILLAMRRASDRVLLIAGVALALFGRLAIELPVTLSGARDALGAAAYYEDAAILQRQALSQAGDYFGLVKHFADGIWVTYLLTGGLLGWILYALGRFFLGAWVGRRGWLQNARTHAAGFRKWMWLLLPAGLAGEALGQFLGSATRLGLLPESALLDAADSVVHMLATPVLVAGYICAIVTIAQTRIGGALCSPLASVGRMALTNYVMQSFIIGLVLFGLGPGLGLAGKIGAAGAMLAAVIGYVLQVILSQVWLSYFAYGPLEWVWRALTYGNTPRLRISPKPAMTGNAG